MKGVGTGNGGAGWEAGMTVMSESLWTAFLRLVWNSVKQGFYKRVNTGDGECS